MGLGTGHPPPPTSKVSQGDGMCPLWKKQRSGKKEPDLDLTRPLHPTGFSKRVSQGVPGTGSLDAPPRGVAEARRGRLRAAAGVWSTRRRGLAAGPGSQFRIPTLPACTAQATDGGLGHSRHHVQGRHSRHVSRNKGRQGEPAADLGVPPRLRPADRNQPRIGK